MSQQISQQTNDCQSEIIKKINNYIQDCSDFHKEKLRQLYQTLGPKIFYERMANDSAFMVWSGKISIIKIKTSILENRNKAYEYK